MSENNKSYRIRTTVGKDNFVSVNLEQDYDAFDILSLKINSVDTYRLHNSNYGVVVGRVLANNGFGIPNAKISIFIEAEDTDDEALRAIYPFTSVASRDENGVRYNLLPDEKVGNCHQVVGTFPNKRFVLDNEDVIEVFDKYYKYTTRTNNSGDYMICGVPTGNQLIHMDLDLSDCGILSQRPRDFVYKGYTIEQFENPNMFKTGTSLSSLSQIFTQDQNVFVQPFWGNDSLGETIGITRADIDVAFKFEPTCVFMGCIASDNASQGISKKCIPTPHMGDMDELTTGEGTIEMIRKTYAGSVEEFQVKGTELIDGNGIWCYQIPMNLDYMITDEYGNMVPTDNPDKGIPTRTRVRFRISMQDMEKGSSTYFRPKVLVPHNPQNTNGMSHEDYDYDFGSNTKDESFRDLFWNNVYTVKSYIPRFQKRKAAGWKEKKFTGIKHVQDFGQNNPMPYNNIRIRLPFMFKIMCILIKIFIKVVSVFNTLISMAGNLLADIGDTKVPVGITIKDWKIQVKWKYPFRKLYDIATQLKMNVIDEGLCPDLENWYFAPMAKNTLWSPDKKLPPGMKKYNLLKQTLDGISMDDDPFSIDDENQDDEDVAKCLTVNTDYLISCIEMNLAQEYKVINFDFYNDWINGLIYIPRFMRYIRKKRKFLGMTIVRQKVRGCMDDTKIFSKSRRYTQQCSLEYKKQTVNKHETYSKVTTNLRNKRQITKSNNFHKKRGFTQATIFGKNGGICHEKTTMYGQYVYYLKPCEWTIKTTPKGRKVNLFATDLVLLGSLNDCDLNGVPQAFSHLTSSSYLMPTNLALTNMEESGPLYAYGDKGTMCSTSNQTTENTDPQRLAEPMHRIEPSDGNALSNELNFYSGASTNYDVDYDDPSDTIAMTEAAGIAWNFTGPGQGKINKKKLYYPGGHFLGLSCVNSQTNIKSCVNLERICELGSTMSQRKEDVYAVKDNGNGVSELAYMYIAPTGLISGDDIIDDEFRTMFATMNRKRLIATKTNPDTGYKAYDFTFSNPINFSGELSKYTGAGTPYNTAPENVTDESTLLAKFGIEMASSRDDYDPDEVGKTMRRTIEFSSLDYYMFRLGLSYDDVKKGSAKHLRQFALTKNGSMYLPQYENSFYFYFGMRDGSTALDEFNKQFFSECETSTVSEREPSVFIPETAFDVNTGESEPIVPDVSNVEFPIIMEIYKKDTKGTSLVNSRRYEDEYEFESDENLITLGRGDYIMRIYDSEGTEVTTEFSVGKNILDGLFTAFDFNTPSNDSPRPSNTASSNTIKTIIYDGGYIHGENISVSGVSELYLSAIPRGEVGAEIKLRVDENGECVLPLRKSDVIYDLYVEYNGTSGPISFNVGEFMLLDSNSTWLTIGPVSKTPTRELKESGYTIGWWSGSTYDSVNDAYSLIPWNVRKSILNPYPTSASVFSNSVEAVNGVKAVWMTPQNSDGVYPEKVSMTTEYDEAILPGYTVDDDASYHPTYGHPNFNNVYQNNALAYNGASVGGPFAGKVEGQSDKIKYVTSPNHNLLRDGEGCMFKPLPEGDLIPAIYNAGYIFCSGDTDDIMAATDGVVYPTFVYPIIRRPFSVNANYFEVSGKYLAPSEGDTEDDVSIFNGIMSGRCEATITNGVTFKNHFCGESYMSMVFGDAENDEGSTNFAAPTSDLSNIAATYSTDRVMKLYGTVSGATEDVSYLITEGYPLFENRRGGLSAYKEDSTFTKTFSAASLYAAASESAELSLDATFYDNIMYRNSPNGAVFVGDGTSDGDIDYYVLPPTATTNVIETRTGTTMNDYITYVKSNWLNGRKYVYVAGYYTENAEFDTHGADTLVMLKDAGFKINAYVYYTEEPSDAGDDADGPSTLVKHKYKKISKNDSIHTNSDFGGYLTATTDACDGRVAFLKRKSIKENMFTSNSDSLTQYLLGVIDRNGMTPITFGQPSGSTPSNFTVVGVKRYTDETGIATGTRCMIYLYPTEIKSSINNSTS